MTIDLICQVVDNYGDMAVVWRLAQALAQTSGRTLQIRILADDLALFHQLCPAVDPQLDQQRLTVDGADYLVYCSEALPRLSYYRTDPADVIVEAFGAPTPVVCLEHFFQAALSGPGILQKRLVLHLEYLTAEAWSEEYHLLPSPIGREGVERFFFVPGFRARAGGLIFMPQAPTVAIERGAEDWLMTLFSYEHNYLNFWRELAEFLEDRQQTARVLVFQGRSLAGAMASWQDLNQTWQAPRQQAALARITVEISPFLDQATYTALLSVGDFHVVRGEESWTQAVLSGKPFLWHAYLQPEGHQRVKVEAFLDVLEPRFAAEGEAGRRIFAQLAASFRSFNQRFENSADIEPVEQYRVFWEGRAVLERVLGDWAVELRKNANLSQKMLDFLATFRV